MLKKTKWTKKCSKSSLASPGLAVLNHDVFLPVWMLFIAVKWDFLFCPPAPLKKIPAARCWSVTCRFAGFSVNLIGWKEQMAKRSLLVYRKDRWQHENGMFRNPPTDGSKIGRNSFEIVYKQTLVEWVPVASQTSSSRSGRLYRSTHLCRGTAFSQLLVLKNTVHTRVSIKIGALNG